MSIKNWPGGRISPTPPTPSGPFQDSTASGVWTLEQQAYWESQGLWPTAGAINPDLFIENLFSTYLYTGNGSTQTITNGIDLAGKGGMVWQKTRNQPFNHALYDTVRGTSGGFGLGLISNSTSAQVTGSGNYLTTFNSNGFTASANGSTSGDNWVSWTFREQQKFFVAVTWSGNNASTRAISHNLGAVPGCIIVKQINDARGWPVYHRMLNNGTNPQNYFIGLDETTVEDVDTGGQRWGATAPTSTTFTVGSQSNASGGTYIAYLFAHNAGGFGLAGTDNVISCGSYTGNGSATGPVIDLGYEPQWVMVKRTNAASNWTMFDTMRGMSQTSARLLYANQADDEGIGTQGWVVPNATGFQLAITQSSVNASGGNYIYIAIRRGPMRTPTTGTSVFTPYQVPASPTTGAITGFVTDAGFIGSRAGADKFAWGARLMGNPTLNSTNTNAESANTNQIWDRMNGWWNTAINNYMTWGFARAPGFMDVVCYTGVNPGGQTLTVSHNLGVAPELIINKRRSNSYDWLVYSAPTGSSNTLYLNLTNASTAYTSFSDITSTTFKANGVANTDTDTYVSYLFASCPGVSKVGSFTGTGATQVINCGFTTGARFVLIKATSTTGGWLIWDSARGIVAGNDPYLALNSTAAEVTGTDWVDTAASGFELSNAGGNLANSNGVSYIFLAIA